METRTAEILKAAVQEFIRSGEPVSSEWLFAHGNFGIKPAMIRFELSNLTDAGYLVQPHTAAGRVPSDKGYEFFARRALAEDAAQPEPKLANLFREEAWPEFLSAFSETLDILGTAAIFPERAVYKSPLSDLAKSFDWDANDLRDLIQDFESLEERLARMRSAIQDDLQVFVGRKSPITKGENLAVIAAHYALNGQEVFLCAIGPKRMNYRKTAKVMKGLQTDAPNNAQRAKA